MQKEKPYDRVRFSTEVIKEAAEVFYQQTKTKASNVRRQLEVTVNGETWRHDSESDYFSDYRRGPSESVYQISGATSSLRVYFFADHTSVTVEAETRSQIQEVFEIFEAHVAASRLPERPAPPRPKPIIFIGHGRNMAWRDLKDHLQDKHNFRVEAYEIGARAGHAIRDILEEMLTKSSMAFLVMTAEDETADGGIRARQNVVHEVGLFQGKLGFSRAIVLLEDGTEAFSNISGIDQIRFRNGNIRETFGEVLATIRREFPSHVV